MGTLFLAHPKVLKTVKKLVKSCLFGSGLYKEFGILIRSQKLLKKCNLFGSGLGHQKVRGVPNFAIIILVLPQSDIQSP